MDSTPRPGDMQGSYLIRLMLLVAGAFGGGTLFSLIGAGIGVLFYGVSDFNDFFEVAKHDSLPDMAVLVYETLITVGIFLVPAALYAIVNRQSASTLYKTESLPRLAPLLFLVPLGLLIESWLVVGIEFNKLLEYPMELLGWLEPMQAADARLEEQYIDKLTFRSTAEVIAGLFSIALVPAICEEVLFRGALQDLFGKWSKKTHVAIWVTAAIFSLIHLQFSLFIPRLMMGAYFGYIMLWTGNLWYPIAAHFVNNAIIVLISYYRLQQGEAVEHAESDTLIWIWMIPQLAFFVLGLVAYRKWMQRLQAPPNE